MQRHMTYWLLVCLLFGVVIIDPCSAQPPRWISLQGKLGDGFSEPLPDDDYPIVFSIYGEAVGGSPLWQESLNVPVSGGIYNVILGT